MGVKTVDARLSVVRYTNGSYDIETFGLPTLESVRSVLHMVERYTIHKKRKGELGSKIEPPSPIGSHPVTARKETAENGGSTRKG